MIRRPKGSAFVLFREDYQYICEGDVQTAMILAIYEFRGSAEAVVIREADIAKAVGGTEKTVRLKRSWLIDRGLLIRAEVDPGGRAGKGALQFAEATVQQLVDAYYAGKEAGKITGFQDAALRAEAGKITGLPGGEAGKITGFEGVKPVKLPASANGHAMPTVNKELRKNTDGKKKPSVSDSPAADGRTERARRAAKELSGIAKQYPNTAYARALNKPLNLGYKFADLLPTVEAVEQFFDFAWSEFKAGKSPEYSKGPKTAGLLFHWAETWNEKRIEAEAAEAAVLQAQAAAAVVSCEACGDRGLIGEFPQEYTTPQVCAAIASGAAEICGCSRGVGVREMYEAFAPDYGLPSAVKIPPASVMAAGVSMAGVGQG